MGKKSIIFAVALAACAMFLAVGLYASSSPDIIPMDAPIYKKHKKPIVQFTHKKHYTDFGAKCADCHHNDKGEPLTDLKEGDPVQHCYDCHKIPGEMPKKEKKAIKKLPKDEQLKKKLAYQAEALHMNCKDCHKAWNKEHGKKGKDGAPTSCNACHPKKKK